MTSEDKTTALVISAICLFGSAIYGIDAYISARQIDSYRAHKEVMATIQLQTLQAEAEVAKLRAIEIACSESLVDAEGNVYHRK